MKMGETTVVFGALLIVLGVGGYLGTGTASVTALIPAFFGAPLALLGFLARNDRLRMHAMHGAALLGLIGFVVPGVMAGRKLPALLSGDEVARPTAVVVQTLMALICGVFLALCIRSFVIARQSRADQTKAV